MLVLLVSTLGREMRSVAVLRTVQAFLELLGVCFRICCTAAGVAILRMYALKDCLNDHALVLPLS
ncbi:hypothetical protein C8Q76DRAFT_709854 [Earliella scabrosa]|nr:hypothetical protein C8Q76DRAFT_709854 [Earliella scabrosa]